MLSASASAPVILPAKKSTGGDPVSGVTNEKMLPLPFLLEDWCSRGGLDEGTAPLLAMLAWAQRDATDPLEADGWSAVGIACEQSELSLQRSPEPHALHEREQSRFADAALGGGPVTVQLAPPETGLAATPSVPALPVSAERHGTFGSSRDEAPLPSGFLAPLPDTMRPGIVNAARFQLPGPGSYSLATDGRTSRTDTAGLSHGARWAKDDRQKHLGYSVRPKNQFHALPLQCGPAPGFYSNPEFGATSSKERLPRGLRCKAKLFMDASELPAGKPPERNHDKVRMVRSLNQQGREGVSPAAYNTLEAAKHYSQHPSRGVGRFSSKLPPRGKPGAATGKKGETGGATTSEGTRDTSPGRAVPAATTAIY